MEVALRVRCFRFFHSHEDTAVKKLMVVLIACLGMPLAQAALAQDNVIRIGAIYPLSGALASTGSELKQAIELAVDVINKPHPELKDIPLAAGAGLPHLGGAKVEVVFADSQGKPEVGQAEAQRLIDQEHVVALIGAYQSAVTKTTSRIAEQRAMPFLNPESSSPDLTERGYKWFFRTTPNDETFIGNMMQFLDEVKTVPTKKIGVVYENTDFGVNTYKALQDFAKRSGREIVVNVAYAAGTASVDFRQLHVGCLALRADDARNELRAADFSGERRRLHRFALRLRGRTPGTGRADARCVGERSVHDQAGDQAIERPLQVAFGRQGVERQQRALAAGDARTRGCHRPGGIDEAGCDPPGARLDRS
jgi:hypothetical protein